MVFTPSLQAAQEPWRTGKEFQQQLRQQVSLTWEGIELRRAMEQLAHSQRVAILVDRRLDPQQILHAQIENRPLLSAIEQVLPEDASLSVLDDVIYVGPSDTAQWLRTAVHQLEQRARDFPPGEQKAWFARAPLAWPTESEPRTILQKLLAKPSVEVNLSAIPHDLWPAYDLPPLSRIDRLSLILANFALTWQWQGDAAHLELLPLRPLSVERSYRASPALDRRLAQLQSGEPNLQWSTDRGQTVVLARIEAHEQLATPRDRAPTKERTTAGSSGSGRRFQLKVPKAPLNKVLDQLADQVNFTWQVDPSLSAANIDLAELTVQLDVTDLTLDQLLAAILQPHGLRFRRSGSEVTLFPAP
jgi:hypothetical protein